MVEHWIWLSNLRWEVLCLFIWQEGGMRWGLQGRRGGSGKYFGFSNKWLKCGRKGSGYTYFGISFSVNTCGWIVEYIFIAGKFQLRNLGVHFDQIKTFQARCEPVLWFCLFVPPISLFSLFFSPQFFSSLLFFQTRCEPVLWGAWRPSRLIFDTWRPVTRGRLIFWRLV